MLFPNRNFGMVIAWAYGGLRHVILTKIGTGMNKA
jgi:hypothetical protein